MPRRRGVAPRPPPRLDGQTRGTERLWRRLARAPEAVAGIPVAGPPTGSAELPGAARRALRRHRTRAGALPEGQFDHAAVLSLLLPSSPHSSLTRGSISLFCLASISSGETGLSSKWGTLDGPARSPAESGDLESGLTAAPSAASLWALCGFPACAAGPEGAAARPVCAKSQPQEARELSCGPTKPL